MRALHRRQLVIAWLVAAGCSERALPLPLPDGGEVRAPTDLAPHDPAPDLDLAVGADLLASDLATSDGTVLDATPAADLSAIDLAAPEDLTRPPDLRPPPDLAINPRATLAFVGQPRVSLAKHGTIVLALAAGDFDGDGHTDVAAANWGVNYTGSAGILLGDGRGGLTLTSSLYAGGGPESVAVADVNNDGRDDLVVGGESVWMFPGLGDGHFAAPQKSLSTPGCIINGVGLADANADGWIDVLGAGTSCGSSSGVEVWLGAPAGLAAKSASFLAGQTPESLAIGRFGGSAQPGVVLTDRGDPATGMHSAIDVFVGRGDGTLATPTAYPTHDYPYGVAVGDFDGNGLDDVVVAEYSGGVGVFVAGASGAFGAERHLTGARTFDVVVGDFNSDGRLDFATADAFASSVSVWLGNGDATFQPPSTTPIANSARTLITADFDGDGLLDLAVGGDGPYVSVVLNRSR